MDRLQDEVEAEQDAVLLDPSLGPMTYLSSDGRMLLDMRGLDGEPMRVATDDEAITALVVGAKKCAIGALLDLIPAPPREHTSMTVTRAKHLRDHGASAACVVGRPP